MLISKPNPTINLIRIIRTKSSNISLFQINIVSRIITIININFVQSITSIKLSAQQESL